MFSLYMPTGMQGLKYSVANISYSLNNPNSMFYTNHLENVVGNCQAKEQHPAFIRLVIEDTDI